MDIPNPVSPGTNIAQGSTSWNPGGFSYLSSSPMDQSNFGSVMDTPNPVSAGTNIAQENTSWNPGGTSSFPQYEPLLKVVRRGDLIYTEKFLKDHPEAVKAKITSMGETALNVAACFGHFHIVEKLLQLISKDDIEFKRDLIMTSLYCADFSRNKNGINVVKGMVEKNRGLVTDPDANGLLPVTLALINGHTEMARHLYSITPFQVLQGKLGAEFLVGCCISKMFGMALDLIKRYPRLIAERGQSPVSFLEALASVPSPCLNETELPFWKRWLHKWVDVHQEPAEAINEVVIDIPETSERRDDYARATSRGLLHQLVKNTLQLLGHKEIYEARLAHMQYLELLRAIGKAISTLDEEEIGKTGIYSAILIAAQRGNPEFIKEAIKAHLPLLWAETGDKKNLFFWAVQLRHAKVFNLIHEPVMNHTFSNITDIYGNCLLHMAGFLAPSAQLNRIPGALLQMQRELQWFKEVESITPPRMKERCNNVNMTPRDLFTESHKDLVKQGEEWTKGVASSCSVVAALVATITFAAAFTVPGGNDQNMGYPIFLHKKLFMLFMISNAVSLFSSTTSLLMFLGLLTSRYAEDDFLKSLPKRLIIGLSTMCISLATMMIAFCAAVFLMLQNQSWIVIPVTLLASVPVTLYIWLQFPLLLEIFKSTYGPGIFDRNAKPWL